MSTADERARSIVEAILKAYHTTRLDPDPVPHILGKPYVQAALTTAIHQLDEARSQALEAAHKIELLGIAYECDDHIAQLEARKELTTFAAAIRALGKDVS